MDLNSEQKNIYSDFLKSIKESKVVWVLENGKGYWPAAPREEKEKKDIILFWSYKAYAEYASKNEWAEFKPATIDFEKFCNDHLKGCLFDGFLVGIDWYKNSICLEIEPIELIRDINKVDEKT